MVGPDRAPIAGAAVLAGSSARTFSAADGSFALAVEDGQASSTIHLNAGEEGWVEVDLGNARTTAGLDRPLP